MLPLQASCATIAAAMAPRQLAVCSARGVPRARSRRRRPRSCSRLACCSAASSGVEQRPPGHAQALDQASDEDVGRRRCRARPRRCGAARRSAGCARAPPGGTCGRLDRGGEPRDQVELAPARDLDHAREVDLAQLDRRAGERAHDRGGVLRIDEQAHPGEHVAHLGALEERRRVRAPRRAVAVSDAGAILATGTALEIRAP